MGKYKEFIKEAYQGKTGLTMCDDWKDVIKVKFPELTESEKSLKELTNEGIKRGYRNGVTIKTLEVQKMCETYVLQDTCGSFYMEGGSFWFGSEQIYHNGIWAEIITKTW